MRDSLVSEHHHVHLLAECGSARASLMLNSLAVHAHLNAPPKATASALVPPRLVHLASSVLSGLAGILPPSANGALEEASAAVASKDTVVLARGEITAHLAGRVIKNPAGRASTASSFGRSWTSISKVQAVIRIVRTAAAYWIFSWL
jgi:hypothetical protein